MGKTKNKRFKASKAQPTGLSSVHDLEQQFELTMGDMSCSNGDSVSNTVLALVDKLQSPSAEEKECSLASIANLVSQPGSVVQFLKADLVKVGGPLLVDPSLPVRHAMLGAFRNLTVDGGPDVCDKMVSDDIMTPLMALLQQYQNAEKSGTFAGNDDVEVDILYQAVHLLWNLCESSGVAVKIATRQESLFLLLRSYFVAPNTSVESSLAAGQCLYTVTEDNPDAHKQLANSETLALLKSLLAGPADDSRQLLRQTLAAGILYNLWGGQLGHDTGVAVHEVITVLANTLRPNAADTVRETSQLLTTVTESAPGEPAGRNVGQGDAQAQANSLDGDTVDDRAMDDGAEDEGCAPESDAKLAKDGPSESDDTLEIKHRDLEKRVADVHHLLQAQQLAVELVANLSCSGEDDDWEDLDCSDASSDDLAADVAGTDMAEDDGDSNQYGLSLPAEVKDAFISNGLIPTVLAKVQGTDQSSIDNLNTHSQGRKLVKGLCDLQLRSLLCVNNVVSLLDVEEVGGLDTLHTLWPTLSEMAIQKTVIENTALLEAVTSALRAVIQKLGELGSSKLLAVSDSDMQFLYEMALQSAEPNIRVNVVRIVSSLGCVLAKQPQAPPMLQSVGLFLLEAAARDQTLWVVAEALDALFDVFAEDSTDPIVSQIGLVHKLRDMFPALKTKVQQQRRHLGEHLPIVMMAKSNLTRFIKYKASHAGPT